MPSPARRSHRGSCGASMASIRRPRSSAALRRTPWCWRPPASPASPTPTGSWPWPAPPNGRSLPYTLSTLSTRSIEEVRAVSAGRLWFQVYAWRDRGLVEEMIARAADARYEALVLTVDTAVFGRRERDVRRGFALPPTIGPGTLLDGARHPAWSLAFVRSEADPVRQRRRARRRRRRLTRDVVGLREPPVRPVAVLGRRRLAPLGVGRADRREGHPDGRRRGARGRAGRRGRVPVEPRWPPARRRTGDPRPGRAGRRCRRRSGRDRLRRRRSPGQRHRQGRRRRKRRAAMAGQAYLYGLGAAGEQGVDRGPPSGSGPTWPARWPSSARVRFRTSTGACSAEPLTGRWPRANGVPARTRPTGVARWAGRRDGPARSAATVARATPVVGGSNESGSRTITELLEIRRRRSERFGVAV